MPDGDTQSIANSPLTVAMPKPMAEALGWPAKPIGWKDLTALATDPAGWAKYGHPEWGKFRLGKTNPNISTAGLNATIGAYYAATGTSSDLTAAALEKPEARQFVSNIEQAIVHYGDNTLTFLTNLQKADDRGAALSYISAVTVEESSLIGYNQGNPTNDPAKVGQHAPPKVPLVAIYPADGTLNSDHPFVTLNWADPTRKQIAADFLDYLRGPETQPKFGALGFRSFDGKPGPQVTTANGTQPDAKISFLRPPSPTVLSKLLTTWTDLRKKANVLLVVDVSGSMGESVSGTGKSKIDLAKQAAIDALGQFVPRDQVGLWQFSTRLDGDKDYQELVPVQALGASGKDTLAARLGGLTPQSGHGVVRLVAGRLRVHEGARRPGGDQRGRRADRRPQRGLRRCRHRAPAAAAAAGGQLGDGPAVHDRLRLGRRPGRAEADRGGDRGIGVRLVQTGLHQPGLHLCDIEFLNEVRS